MIQPDSAKFLAQDVEARHSDSIPPTEAMAKIDENSTLEQILSVLKGGLPAASNQSEKCDTLMVVEGTPLADYLKTEQELTEDVADETQSTELYDYRDLLFALAVKLSNWSNGDCNPKGWKSWQHRHEMPMYDGRFVAGLELPTGQIHYYLPAKMWTLVQLPSCDRAPEWDGNTAKQELKKIEAYLKYIKAYVCLLLAIVFRGDEGILEATIAQYALLNISEAIDVTEAIDQFERAGWISTDWEVLMGESKSFKTRRCKISEAGRHAAEVAQDIFPIV